MPARERRALYRRSLTALGARGTRTRGAFLADRRLRQRMDRARRGSFVSDRRDQQRSLFRPHDAARDSHSRGRASPRDRPASRAFLVGAHAALAAPTGNVVTKPVLGHDLENADGAAGRLAVARPGSLGLASADAVPGGAWQ